MVKSAAKENKTKKEKEGFRRKKLLSQIGGSRKASLRGWHRSKDLRTVRSEPEVEVCLVCCSRFNQEAKRARDREVIRGRSWEPGKTQKGLWLSVCVKWELLAEFEWDRYFLTLLGKEKTVLGEVKEEQRDQKGGRCNHLSEDPLKLLLGKFFWEQTRYISAFECQTTETDVLIDFNLPRYHLTERLSACYKLS